LGIPRKGVIFLTVEDSLGQNKRPMGDLIKPRSIEPRGEGRKKMLGNDEESLRKNKQSPPVFKK